MNEMGSLEQILETKRGKGVATVMAIGTAVPSNYILQADYPDFYFKVTKSDHMLHLKQKFNTLCENSMIEKRHFVYNEEYLKQNSNISCYGAPSLDTRQGIAAEEVPKLGKEAAVKAIREWGQPSSRITHLIFYTTSCFGNLPSSDYHLAKLLGLPPTLNRLMLFNIGCHAGGTALRLAKDIAENNASSRVLVVWAETMLGSFHGPNANHIDILIGQALFGDGAAAMIIGADPIPSVESPLFELVSASQTTVPDTASVIHGCPQEMGLVYYLSKEIPNVVSENIEKGLSDALNLIGAVKGDIIDWNRFFYAVHPGGPAILNKVEEKLGLDKNKLRASRDALRQYGNLWGPSVVFVLDEMRKWSNKEGKSTTGEGLEWGVLATFGPGISIEIIVLRSASIYGLPNN